VGKKPKSEVEQLEASVQAEIQINKKLLKEIAAEKSIGAMINEISNLERDLTDEEWIDKHAHLKEPDVIAEMKFERGARLVRLKAMCEEHELEFIPTLAVNSWYSTEWEEDDIEESIKEFEALLGATEDAMNALKSLKPKT
jgi:hypothetical protein